MIASQEGNLEVVRTLLREGALPNATTVRGSTALIQACHFGKLSVAEELLAHGALVDQANLKNTTALMRASQEGHEVRTFLSQWGTLSPSFYSNAPFYFADAPLLLLPGRRAAAPFQ